ncbi:MAG: hypothetical protein ACOZF2_07300 [Thermodesulfobacteriota bacterium]
MAEQVTNCLGESCIGCRYLHLQLGQYRCFKARHAAEGEFICFPKIGTQYPRPIHNRERCYKAD